MADFFCDHGAYASALGTTPTWGVPQEGDGSSKYAATAASVASIAFASVPTSGLMSVCGINIGTTGVIGAANVGAAADALAGLINAVATTVAAGVAVGTPQLRNLVYARGPTLGAPAGTCQIMMRIGSATLNQATNSNAAIASTFDGTPTLVQFVGGTGGCWGWLFNTSAIGVASSYAALAYGVAVSASPLVSVSSAAVSAKPTITDDIYVRTASGYTLTCAVNTCPNWGTPNYSHNLIFDSNTVWTGDSGTGVVTVSMSNTSADLSLYLCPSAVGLFKSVRCIKKNSLQFYWASNTSGHFQIIGNSSGGGVSPTLLDGLLFEEATNIVAASAMSFMCNGVIVSLRLKNCTTKHMTARTTWSRGLLFGAFEGTLIFEGCTTITNHTGGSDPGPVLVGAQPNSGSGTVIKLIGHSISGWAFGNYRALNTVSAQANLDVVVDGCTGFALGAYVGIQSNNKLTNTYTFTSPTLGFRHEYGAGVVDWNPSASPAYPTRNALTFDGVSWSIKMDWFAATASVIINLLTPKLATISRLANGVRTVAVDFLSPVTLTAKNVALRVHYVSTDGKAYCDTTWAKSSALTQPGATWAGSGSYPSHVSNRLTLATTNAVAMGTEIFCFLEIVGPPPGGSGIQLYVDPEMGLT